MLRHLNKVASIPPQIVRRSIIEALVESAQSPGRYVTVSPRSHSRATALCSELSRSSRCTLSEIVIKLKSCHR